jgi:hypothetical protein
MISVPLRRRRGRNNRGGAKLWTNPWISGWTNPIFDACFGASFLEMRDSRGKQIDIEAVNLTCEKTKN